MRNLVFIEGLWHTGKSYFLEYLQSIKTPKDEHVRITTDIRELGTIRHAAYSLYPEIYPEFDLIFDRSPVTLKSISNSKLGIYDNLYINPIYWESFYSQWVKEMSSLTLEDTKIIFLYFNPFNKNRKIAKEIISYIRNYNKPFLMIKKKLITEQKLIELHDIFIEELLNLHSSFLGFKIYPIEYRDKESAIEILKKEKILF